MRSQVLGVLGDRRETDHAPGHAPGRAAGRASVLLGAIAALGVTALDGSARADADSLNDLLGPREIAVGEAMRGGATGQAAVNLNPGGLPLNRELVFEGGFGYRGSDSASLIGVSACDSTAALPGCFFYDYAGASPDLGDMKLSTTTHVGGLSMSRTLLPRILIGATAKYFHFSSDMADADASGTAFDLGATVRVTELINFGVSAQNLWSSSDTPAFPRAVGGGVYARPIPLLALSFDMRWKLDGEAQAARYGGGAELFLSGNRGQSGYPIRVGALRDNSEAATYLSAGLGYASISWGIDVAGRRQVKGGDATMIIASMRFFGPRMASPELQ